MDIATSYGLTYGLALSSGVNAYFPLLAFALAARWLHLYKVNPSFSFVTQTWFMVLLAILALADLFADKIPVVDHLWDAIHTVIRPLAGALVAASSDNRIHIPGATNYAGSHIMTMGITLSVTLVIVMLIGAALALMTHTTKAATRVASTATTAGLLNIVLSIVEDIGVVIATLLSLFAPAIMFVIIVIFVLVFLLLARRIIRLFNRRRNQHIGYTYRS
ncbi:MAG: DUF4126 domain-containing protein [Ktedonobacteraceae bacterium]